MILERGAYVLRVAVQVMPGEANKGLFIDLKAPSPGAGEVSSNTGPDGGHVLSVNHLH
jgi:hypothetical protein